MVGRGCGSRRTRRGPRAGRVDGRGRTRDRPSGLGHRPLLRASEERGARASAGVGGLQQDLRDRPPRRAVGVGPRRSPVSLPRARAPARRCLLRGRRLGSGRTGTSPMRAWWRSTGSRGARPSGTRAGGRRSSTPSTWRCATAPGCSTSRRSASSTSWAGGARVRAASLHAPDGREARQGGLHPGADPRRRLSLRPDGDASATSTSGWSPAARTGWRTSRPTPTSCPRTARPRSSTSPRAGARSACGAARPRHPRRHHRRRHLARGLPVRHLSHDRDGLAAGTASRISYVGDLGWELYVLIEQGAKLWDMVAEAGEPHGIVPVGIGVYGTTGRLEVLPRLRSSSTASTTWSRPAWPGARSRTRTSSARRPTCASARPSRPPSCARSPSTTTPRRAA